MRTSEQINELAAALAAAQGDIENAAADAKNPHFNSSYADLASVRAAIKGPLSKHGLAIFQLPITVDGKPALLSRMMHKSGQWMEGECVLQVEKPTMQGLGSAITYMKRYALNAMTGVAEEDDDGNAASKTPAKAAQKPAVAPKPIETGVIPNTAPSTPPGSSQTAKTGAGVTDKQRKMVWARIKGLDYSDEEAKEFFIAHSGKQHSADWTRQDFDRVLNAIDVLEKKQPPEDAGDAWEPPND